LKKQARKYFKKEKEEKRKEENSLFFCPVCYIECDEKEVIYNN